MPTAKKNKKRQLKFTKAAETAPKFYANNTNILLTNFDMRLTFSQIVSASDEHLDVEPQVSVHMSPQHAKAVLVLLAGQVQAYEEKEGEIKLHIESTTKVPS